MDLELSIPHLYVPRSESWESGFITTSFNKCTDLIQNVHVGEYNCIKGSCGIKGLPVN